MSYKKNKDFERAFMLDCARKYFTPRWIKRLVDEISTLGYNAIYIHFGEDIGHRLESKLYPWLAGGDYSLCVYGKDKGIPEDDGKYITQDEMADIVRYALDKGLTVIPSFDSPGHMNYAVKKYKEHCGRDIGNYFHKDGRVAIVQGSSVNKEEEQLSYSRGIDITNPEAVTFATSLYDEYAKFFYGLGCRIFDMGGDELLGFGATIDPSLPKWHNLEHWDTEAKRLTANDSAVAYDAFLLYMNGIAEHLFSLGYEHVRMWNDEALRAFDTGWSGVVELDRRIEIQYWTPPSIVGGNTPRLYIEKGHPVYNFTYYYSYYDLGFGFKNDVTPERIEAEWAPNIFFPDGSQDNLAEDEDMLRGCGFCLWTDVPSGETEDELMESIRPFFTAYAKKFI